MIMRAVNRLFFAVVVAFLCCCGVSRAQIPAFSPSARVAPRLLHSGRLQHLLQPHQQLRQSTSTIRCYAFPWHALRRRQRRVGTSEALSTSKGDDNQGGDDICTVQILMSDTGGGHRASANALRDAFDVLHPGQIKCDIVDIYTDYGPFWPYNDYVGMYKFMAKYPVTWDAFYSFGETDFGMCVNEIMLEAFCYDAFKQCLVRPSCGTIQRADMVVSVHPLCQDIPLKILADLDSNGKTRNPEYPRTTPFATVVTDLGSAHPTWFNKQYVRERAEGPIAEPSFDSPTNTALLFSQLCHFFIITLSRIRTASTGASSHPTL